MESVFLTIVNMSITATYVLAVVLVLRLILKRAPKWLSYSLWFLVIFRLICPVSFSSSFALIGNLITPPATQGIIHYIPSDIGMSATPHVDLGVPSINEVINQVLPGETTLASVNPMQMMISIGTWLWLAGFLAMLAYGVTSYIQLQQRIHAATRLNENVYESDEIATPFVCGFFKPCNYLPIGLSTEELDFVLRHERAHLERHDHQVKPLVFILLSIHWFNPLMWLAFRLMSRDMEMCCDERVIRNLDHDKKANYGAALVRLAMNRPLLSGSPLAFGESRIKGRVKNILNFKKPVFWVTIVLIVVLILAGFTLLANPLATVDQDDLSTLDGFTGALKQQLGSIVDITKQENQKKPGGFTEHQRILQYAEEYIFVELAVDTPVEEIVNDRLTDINNPLVDRLWPVHLYVKGNLVVEYSGKNEKLLKALVRLLGKELPHNVPEPIETTASTIEPTPTSVATAEHTSEMTVKPIEITLPENNQGIFVFQSIPAEQPILVDLNSDHINETIFLSKGANGNKYQLNVNDEIVSTGSPFPDILSLVDLDKRDDYIDIAMQLPGVLASDVTFFYYDGLKLISRRTISTTNDTNGAIAPPDKLGDLVLDGQGGLIANTRGIILCTWFLKETWQIVSNGLLEVVPEYYSMAYDDGNAMMEYQVTLKVDLPLFSSPEPVLSSFTAKAGESASLVKTDNRAWVQLRTQSGKLGWFQMEKTEGNDFIDMIKIGTDYCSSMDVFEGLPLGG